MATAVLGLIGHTEIDDADTNTDWDAFTTADADIKREGTNAMSGILRADGATGSVTKGAPISCAGEHLRLWINTINTPYMEDAVGGGYELYVNDGTNTDYYTVFSSDDYTGGWFNIVVDCALFTTVTPANVETWGIRANHHTSGKNAINTWVDFCRYSDGYYVTGGSNGDELDLALIAARDADDGGGNLRGYGILLEKDGVFFSTGKVNWGNGTTTTYFKMDGEVLAFVDNPVATNFHEFSAAGTVADIEIKDSTILAAGISDDVRFVFDMSAANVLDMAGTVLNRAAIVTFASGQDILGCTFNDCLQIIPDGADLTGSVVKNYEGAADTGAVYYNNAADPSGEFDEMTFEKGTESTHAIEFGTSASQTMTLTDMTFTSYNVDDGQTDSVLLFPDTGGDVTWTVNHAGTTGTLSYKKVRGTDTVNIVSSLLMTVTVYDKEDGLIESGVQTAIFKTSDRTEIMNEDTDGVGQAVNSYPGATPVEVEIRCRKASSGADKFGNYSSIQTIPAGTSWSFAVTLERDTINNATT